MTISKPKWKSLNCKKLPKQGGFLQFALQRENLSWSWYHQFVNKAAWDSMHTRLTTGLAVHLRQSTVSHLNVQLIEIIHLDCFNFFYLFLLHQARRNSLSSSFLLPQSQRGRSFWPSQRGGSWSGPAHARGGWSAPLPQCPSGSSLPPWALCTSACRAWCRPLCQHIGLAVSGIALPHVSRSHCSTPSRRRRWCSAFFVNIFVFQ